MVDHLSKYGHFIGPCHPFSVNSIASIFIHEVVRLHGFPKSIVSDRYKFFMSNFWQSLFKSQGTSLKMRTTYHPQTNGQTEVVNRCIETYLCCFASSKPDSWAKFLPWAKYWYNTSFHSATQTSPFLVVYGWEPPPLISGTPIALPNLEVDTLLQDRDIMITVLREQLLRAQQCMKTAIDHHRRNLSFEVGDSVCLKFQLYRHLSLMHWLNEKLAPIFYGPFQVLQSVGKVAYKLQLFTLFFTSPSSDLLLEIFYRP